MTNNSTAIHPTLKENYLACKFYSKYYKIQCFAEYYMSGSGTKRHDGLEYGQFGHVTKLLLMLL